MAPAARLRSWFAGGPGIGTLFNVNNCGLEENNGELKEKTERNSPFDRFLLSTGEHLRSKSLVSDPDYINHEPYQESPTIPSSMWVLANYNFIESSRAVPNRFIHILKAFASDDCPLVSGEPVT